MKKGKSPKKGIQYRYEWKHKKSPALSWGMIDDKVRSGSNFARYIMRRLRDEIGQEGFAVKRFFAKGNWHIIVKKEGLLTSFVVPFMSRKKYDVFIVELVDRILKSYSEIDGDVGENWAALKTNGRGFIS